MAKSGHINFKDFEKIQRNLEQLNQEQVDTFIDACAKELAARLLAKVIKRTPVGDYDKEVSFTTKDGKQVKFTPHTGKKGGTLRRGWTGGKNQAGASYAQSVPIRQVGTKYIIEIINPVEYASYVEFGHRSASHSGWVNGRFMLTISEQEIQSAAPAIIENKLMRQLGELFE